MTATLEDRVQALVARLAAGEDIAAATLPPELVEHPEVARLLRLARVFGQLDANAGEVPVTPPTPERLGPYRLLRLIGSGGMGDVWLGERADGTVEQRVAIKRVRGSIAAFAERLASERRILARLSHPNIARFIDAGVDALGQPWMALEHVDGAAVTDWCARHALPLRPRLLLFRKICAAVAHAHRHLVVHRDIKPGNVLVDHEGEPKLLDFGIAKLIDGSGGGPTAAQLTIAYAAPEQLRGGEISTTTDVYALGLLLFRLLAGALPATRDGANAAAILVRIDEEELQLPSERARARAAELPHAPEALRGDLDAIVSRALRARPEDRYGSVIELSDDIGRYLDALPVLARTPTRRYRLARFVQRHRAAVAVAAVAAIGLALLAATALWQARVATAAAARADQEATRANAAAGLAGQQAQRAKRAFEFVLSVFLQSDPMRRDARGVISLDEAFEDALARIDREFSDEPMVAADLNDDFGEILASKGRFDEAVARLQKALALAEQAHGATSPVVAETLLNLAVVEQYRGRTLDGKPYAARALAILKQHADSEPLSLGNAHFTYGEVLNQEGRRAEALVEAQAGLALYRVHLPADDIRLPIALYNIAASLQHQRRWMDARVVLDEALAIAERLQGERSAALLPVLDVQIAVHDALGEHARALTVAERGLAIAATEFPGSHPRHAEMLVEAGARRVRSGDASGMALIERGVAMLAELGSPNELHGWQLLAGAWWLRGEPAGLATATERGLARCTELGRMHGNACLLLRGYRALGQVREGAPAAALDTLTQAPAPTDAEAERSDGVQLLRWARAEAELALGRHAEARVGIAGVLAYYEHSYSPRHADAQRLRARLAEIDAAR
ncbi:MAG: protein kinase [Xanthomonadales bacterium]|nr:protein kinase [Xanthomonadales bacterium]MCC6560082.1 protein kinase [Xanthomonadales bacterium]